MQFEKVSLAANWTAYAILARRPHSVAKSSTAAHCEFVYIHACRVHACYSISVIRRVRETGGGGGIRSLQVYASRTVVLRYLCDVPLQALNCLTNAHVKSRRKICFESFSALNYRESSLELRIAILLELKVTSNLVSKKKKSFKIQAYLKVRCSTFLIHIYSFLQRALYYFITLSRFKFKITRIL